MISATEGIPLSQTEAGDIFIEGSRIALETLVEAFNAGQTPEDFVRDYPHLSLADIYAVLAYYLHHRQEVDSYVASQYQKADRRRETNPYDNPELLSLIKARVKEQS